MRLQPYNGCRGPVMVCTSREEVEKAMQDKRDNPDLPYDVVEVEDDGHVWGSWIWTGKKWG